MVVKESVIEKYLLSQAKKHSILCYKFTSPGNAGVPDRIVIGNGIVVFVELKRPGGKTRALQDAVIKRMRRAGARVDIIDTKNGVDALIREILEYKT